MSFDLLFWISYIVLWLLVIFLSYIVINTSTKSINNYTPVPLDRGLEIGAKFHESEFESFNYDKIILNMPNKDGSVIFFTKEDCSVCDNVYSILPTIMNKWKNLNVVVFTLGEETYLNDIINKYNLKKVPFVRISERELGEFGLDIFPFVYILSSDGRVISKEAGLLKKDYIPFIKYNYTNIKNNGL